MFRSLAWRNYRYWFVGALVGNVGLWMARVSQDWVVLTELTDNSGLAVGITTGLQFAPQLLLAPVAGTLTDRFSKRRLLIATQIAMGVIALVQGVVVLGGVATLGHMYALAFALGIAGAIDAPARQIFVTEMVDSDCASNAVSLNSVSFNTARMIGPALGGMVIQVVGAGWSFVLNCSAYVLMLAMLLMLDGSRLRTIPRAPRSQSGAGRAFAFLWRTPSVLVVAIVVCVVSTFAMNFPVTIALMAVVHFGRGAGDYGMLSSSIAIGAVFGALWSAQAVVPRFRTVIASAFFLGLTMIAAAFSPTYIAFAGFLMVCGLFMLRLITTAHAFVQLNTPGPLRGRVMSIYLAGFLGGAPFGSPLLGWLGSRFSPPVSILVGAAACLLSVVGVLLWMLFTGRVRVSEVPRLAWPQHPSQVSGLAHLSHPETGPLILPDLASAHDRQTQEQDQRRSNR